MAKAPVMDSVRAAIAFARANVAKVAGVLALVMLLNLAGDMANGPFPLVATTVATLLAGVMANGALLRLAFAGERAGDAEFKIGPQGFQFGKPELRLLGAMLLLLLFGFIGLLFMVLLAALVDVGLIFSHGGGGVLTPEAAAHSPDMQMTSAVLILIFAIAAIWVWLRVFTYPAATVGGKRVQVFSTWGLTRGQTLHILAAVLIVVSPVLVIDGLLFAAQGRPGLMLGLAVVSAAVHAFLEIPLLCGMSAYVYRRAQGVAAVAPRREATAGDPGLAGPWG